MLIEILSPLFFFPCVPHSLSLPQFFFRNPKTKHKYKQKHTVYYSIIERKEVREGDQGIHRQKTFIFNASSVRSNKKQSNCLNPIKIKLNTLYIFIIIHISPKPAIIHIFIEENRAVEYESQKLCLLPLFLDWLN